MNNTAHSYFCTMKFTDGAGEKYVTSVNANATTDVTMC